MFKNKKRDSVAAVHRSDSRKAPEHQRKDSQNKTNPPQKNIDPQGTIVVTIYEARNLSAMAKSGTSDPYCIIQSTFNHQEFKTKVVKKTIQPQWNQTFKFYTSELRGHIFVKVFDKDFRTSLFIGEVCIPVKDLSSGEVHDGWYVMLNEPKKNKNKTKKDPAEIKIRLWYPVQKKREDNKPKLSEPKKITVRDIYDLGDIIGTGGFSVVKQAVHKQTGQKVAVKVIEKGEAGAEELELLQREIDIMRKLKHKNIIELIEVFDEDTTLYLALELVTGGELFEQILKRGNYKERDAAKVVKQILEAIDYMHCNGIAHRDLKPENVLLTLGKDGGPDVIKVTDFGLAKDMGEEMLKTSCGTPDYVAPEVIMGMAYDNSVDIWSIGVITYILLCGFPPFYGNNDQQVFEKIMKAEFDFPSPEWDKISDEAKDFIEKILVLDTNKRPTASQCLDHSWIKGEATEKNDEVLNTNSTLSDYNRKRKR